MGHLYRQIMQHFDQLDTQHWLYVLVGVVIVGFFCLRGFGSRSNY
jgi:hypothetical protein